MESEWIVPKTGLQFALTALRGYAGTVKGHYCYYY